MRTRGSAARLEVRLKTRLVTRSVHAPRRRSAVDSRRAGRCPPECRLGREPGDATDLRPQCSFTAKAGVSAEAPSLAHRTNAEGSCSPARSSHRTFDLLHTGRRSMVRVVNKGLQKEDLRSGSRDGPAAGPHSVPSDADALPDCPHKKDLQLKSF